MVTRMISCKMDKDAEENVGEFEEQELQYAFLPF